MTALHEQEFQLSIRVALSRDRMMCSFMNYTQDDSVMASLAPSQWLDHNRKWKAWPPIRTPHAKKTNNKTENDLSYNCNTDAHINLNPIIHAQLYSAIVLSMLFI